jgi:hypothetical protein
MTRAVWCRRCKLAWHAHVADSAPAVNAAVTPRAQPVRCPRCLCHRGVMLAGDEQQFVREHPDVRWQV